MTTNSENDTALMPLDLVASINEHHEAANRCAQEAVSHALAAGEQLIQLKGKIKHGGFGTWCKKHLGFSYRTARIYMQIAENRQILTDQNGNALPICLRDIPRLLNPANKDEAEKSSETITVVHTESEHKEPVRHYIEVVEKEPEKIIHARPIHVEEEPEAIVHIRPISEEDWKEPVDTKQESREVQSIKLQLDRLSSSSRMDITLYLLDALGYEAVAKAHADNNQYTH